MPYNPWAAWPITGSWANHASYSLGGEDYPLPYGTPLRAPASGTLRTVGGSGEFKAGQVGSAGRRSILELDRPIRDVVAVVVQHQSEYGDNGQHFAEGDVIGWSGASANGNDWGGDVHLHVHCLTASGARRKFTDYFVTAAYPSGPSGGSSSPVNNTPTPSVSRASTPEREEELMAFKYIRAGKTPDNKPRKDAGAQPIYQVSEQVPLRKTSISSNDWAVLFAAGARYIDTNQNVVDEIPGS